MQVIVQPADNNQGTQAGTCTFLSSRAAGGRLDAGEPFVHDEDWQLRAACRDADLALFYSTEEPDTRKALAICDGCPVREACLEVAMYRREAFGVWGGTSEAERRRIFRRERRRQQPAA